MKRVPQKQHLTKEEEKYMDFIWNFPDGILSSKIYAHFTKPRGTSSAILHNISMKGFVSVTQIGREYLYVPIISRLQYKRICMLTMLQEHFGINSLEQFFASFCGRSALTEDQKNQFLSLIDNLEKDDN